ncbi:MAG: restriction endonuclease [Candidatus Viridilinea halotolerans]|uniref:site-specific DNA-methyltransferase (adenine-specific) n=1 Tax=Candidatus Viridilinea halotolerans TaxID=2491704 RepID=A0A426TQV2_9CHLR|nr:MAG: restriction endonuclease [Candidatus Viridilinea halotolerans]
MSIARHHTEWLALLDLSGPFLALPVLMHAFPQGLDAPDADVARELRLAYEEWLDNSRGLQPDSALHRTWVAWVLRRVLALPDQTLRVSGIGHRVSDDWLTVSVPEHGEVLRPDVVIGEPISPDLTPDLAPRILVMIVPPSQGLEKPVARAAWQASPATRMMTLLRGAQVRLGLLTNGEQWMLVDRPEDENATTGFASWYARLWLDEPLTLRAFRSLLGAHRLFGVPASESLEALLAASAHNQQEVTDQLGYQVRRAVELLVQALDLADQNEGGRLLRDLPESELYEAALTVMMRLVFLLFAEEQGLLLLGDAVYDQHYAAATLLSALRKEADAVGEEVLERRYDAWGRLLALFRAVHAGFQHDRLSMPAYGGSLFDPERFPFLEGREGSRKDAKTQSREGSRKDAKTQSRDLEDENLSGFAALREIPGSALREQEARPPLVNNRTVLHLLEALQILRVKVRDGSPFEARRLSFRALDIEQIGHVYEGLLDHTALRATEPILGLAGTRDREPEISLAQLELISRKDAKTQSRDLVNENLSGFAPLREHNNEEFSRKDAKTQSRDLMNENLSAFAPLRENRELLAYLREATGRSESALRKALAAPLDAWRAGQLRAACGNDAALYARVLPFAGLVRDDDYARPLVIPTGSVYVTAGAERRATGTHYTPRSLTEPLVQHTLEPLVYHGPAEGLPKEQWRLRSAEHILTLQVCDMAMGSGAFLVQACRYLAERLVEAVDASRKAAKPQSRDPVDENLCALAPLREHNEDASRKAAKPQSRDPMDENLCAFAPLREISDPEERLILARRLIADRCLYGVDKNPLAVEMAKLSLWLITLAKGRPFSFLDHALRCGDALLGLGAAEQLTRWSLRVDQADHKLDWVTGPVEKALRQAFALRGTIRTTPVLDARDATHKAHLLERAAQAMTFVRLGADLLVAAALAPDPKAREERKGRFLSRYAMLLRAADEGRDVTALYAELQGEADDLLQGRRPFHWPLEFPEVFDSEGSRKAAKPQSRIVSRQDAKPQSRTVSRKAAKPQSRDLMDENLCAFAPLRETSEAALRETSEAPLRETSEAGFAALIGNPPFQGGQRITGALGTSYRDYLVAYLARGVRGSADLCAYFFLRGGTLLQPGGMAGLLATNTLAQGDTREVGLDQLTAAGFAIPRAVPSRPWPGTAGVEVAHVWLRHGAWQGPFVLNEQPVSGITPFLSAPGATSGNPYRLQANQGKSFIGSYVLGMGFVLSPEEAHALIERDPRNREALFPYLNGEDLNSRPDQSPSRWVINFHDWPLERAESYPDLMAIVRAKVKPEREKLGDGNPTAKDRSRRWWQFARQTMNLYATIAGMERVLAIPRVSKYLTCSWRPLGEVPSEATVVIASSASQMFGILQSTFHEEWSRMQGSTLETRMRYTPSDCFETFPFPTCLEESSRQGAKAQSTPNLSGFAALREPSEAALREPLDSIGEAYHTHRQQIMLTRQEGLTKTYNRFHSPAETSADIVELRRLHAAMDNAVAAAYGWEDLDLGHGFHETKQGLRYTISEAARRAVLDRLLALNHERYADEGSRKGAKAQSGERKEGARKGAKAQSRERKGKGGSDVEGQERLL